jgi:predicted O-methyltransferase YrrM
MTTFQVASNVKAKGKDIMTNQELNPGQLLETSGSYWKSCTLHAGVKLGIFTVLGADARTSEEVAQKIEADNRGVQTLLNALTTMNLLARKGNRYTNTELSTAFLLTNSPQYIGHIIMHHHNLVASWSQLDQSVRSGAPVRESSSQSDDAWRESFLMGMFNMAMMIAPLLVKNVDLSDRRRLLDLGGGPGTYAIHFCLNNPQLKATVFDLPTTRPFAKKTIERFRLTDRIGFEAGNYLEDQVAGRYDAVWLSHILHAEGPEDCRVILKKAVSVLEPDGMIIVHDFILNDTLDGPPFPALFALNMLLGTPHGRTYSEREIGNMLTEVGAVDIKRIPVRTPNDSGLIVGTMPGDGS